MKKLSIILPVFNVESLLERCLDSLVHQDLTEEELEIIAINDGSTDGSPEILEKYARKYSHITLIHQKNQGVSVARNKGIELAKGKYIWFVDPDDYISENVCKSLFEKAYSWEVDVLAFDYDCQDISGNPIDWIDFKLDFNAKEKLSGSEFYLRNYNDSYLWVYLFNKEIFTNKDIRFKEGIYMQDSELLPRILKESNSIMYYDQLIYHYTKRRESAINSKHPEVRKKFYSSIIKVSQYLNDFAATLPSRSGLAIGIQKKRANINRMLFLQFLYNQFEPDYLNSMVKDLKDANLFPFSKIRGSQRKKDLVYNFLRIGINMAPISTRNFYIKLNQKRKVQNKNVNISKAKSHTRTFEV